MKKAIVILILSLVGFANTTEAQRIAYIDVQQILTSLPEYQQAQKDLDQAAAKWKQEISREYAEIDEMYRKYQAEEVLLTDTEKKERQDAIVNREKEVRKKQKEKFGTDGSLFQQRQKLVKPLQDKVFKAIETYATDKGYDFVFDKSSNTSMLYANNRYDKTKDIMKLLKTK